MPKSNTNFWLDKLNNNKERDRNNLSKLNALGYRVLVLWECEVINKKTSEINKQIIVDKLERLINDAADK